MRWYAVHTNVGVETKAYASLARAGFTRVFLPFERVKRRRKLPNRDVYLRETVDVPLLPRYLFVLMSELDVGRVNAVDHIHSVVCTPSGYCPPIPDVVINDLMRRADEAGVVRSDDRTAWSKVFKGKPGDAVAFAPESPFRDLLAVIASIEELDDRGQITVFLDLFGARREISVPIQTVEEIVA